MRESHICRRHTISADSSDYREKTEAELITKCMRARVNQDFM